VKVLVDMNISPLCVPALRALGHDVRHWVDVGAPSAADLEIMTWAGERGMVVLTRDLDFADLLGARNVTGPSVIQLRAGRLAVGDLALLVAAALRDFQLELQSGALLTLDATRRRVRLLPINRGQPAGGAEEG